MFQFFFLIWGMTVFLIYTTSNHPHLEVFTICEKDTKFTICEKDTKTEAVILFCRASVSAKLWGPCVYFGSNICSAHALIFPFPISLHCVSW